MIERIRGQGFSAALDVGCGEGRFCRILQLQGVRTVGIDPTEGLIRRARQLDPCGEYRVARAESFDIADGSFDLAVSYLSLIDIADLARALTNIIRVLRPGGTLLIANLTSFNTRPCRTDGCRIATASLAFALIIILMNAPFG